MYFKKTIATIITVLAGLGTILAIACFIIDINGFKGFDALFYMPAILFIAVMFAIIGTVAVHEFKIFFDARKSKKIKAEK